MALVVAVVEVTKEVMATTSATPAAIPSTDNPVRKR